MDTVISKERSLLKEVIAMHVSTKVLQSGNCQSRCGVRSANRTGVAANGKGGGKHPGSERNLQADRANIWVL